MKKFKYIAIAVAACLFCFLFASCAQASYVKNTFVCKVNYNSYEYMADTIQIEGSFYVDLPNAGNYNISFDIIIYNGSNKQMAKKSINKTVSGLGKQKVSIYEYFESEEKASSNDTYTAKLSQLKIEKQKSADSFKSYAIGFGVTGGVLLIGATVFFAVTKKKEKQ